MEELTSFANVTSSVGIDINFSALASWIFVALVAIIAYFLRRFVVTVDKMRQVLDNALIDQAVQREVTDVVKSDINDIKDEQKDHRRILTRHSEEIAAINAKVCK